MSSNHLNPVRHLWSPSTLWTYSTPSSLCSIPADILLEIASHLPTVSDVLHLSLTSTKIYAKVIRAVYTTVELQGVDQCEATLCMLMHQPQIARHVQRLVVHPEISSRIDEDYSIRTWNDTSHVSRLVGGTVRFLDALYAFEWDGGDMLPDDRMWSELRMRCPNLRHVGTTFGCILPRPTSHLLKFGNLKGFSIKFKNGFYAHELHLYSRESQPVFTALWDMLLNRCPELETFSITGTSNMPFDVGHICMARWPCLRTLTISNVIFTSFAASQTEHSLRSFISRHPTLQCLHIFGPQPAELAGLDPSALPCLSDFTGSLDELRALIDRGQAPQLLSAPSQGPSPNSLAKTLRHVSFSTPVQLRELTPFSISRVFSGLHALTTLQITFALQGGYDSNGVLRTIVGTCPHLEHLDLTCLQKPSFYLESCSRSLRGLTRLRSLALTVVKVPGEEPMHIGAARIALANPRLRTFSITYTSSQARASSTSATEYALERGNFELITDDHGIPTSLLVSEWRASLWTAGGSVVQRCMRVFSSVFGISGGRLTRGRRTGWRKRWMYELRSSGHPDAAQKSWAELFMEQSPAGEETRLLSFCFFLFFMALWGLIARAAGFRLTWSL